MRANPRTRLHSTVSLDRGKSKILTFSPKLCVQRLTTVLTAGQILFDGSATSIGRDAYESGISVGALGRPTAKTIGRKHSSSPSPYHPFPCHPCRHPCPSCLHPFPCLPSCLPCLPCLPSFPCLLCRPAG